jgi:hypothetical protein
LENRANGKYDEFVRYCIDLRHPKDILKMEREVIGIRDQSIEFLNMLRGPLLTPCQLANSLCLQNYEHLQ